MKATYQVRPGLTVEVEGEDLKQLMAELSNAAEIFGDACCGACGETGIVPIVRTRGKHTFYEMACTSPACGARLSFGVREDDKRLFPKRKLDAQGKPDMDNGTRGDHNGWTRYHGPGTEDAPKTPVPEKAKAPAEAPDKITPGGLLTPAQREAIGTALRVSGIGRQTFLRWCGYSDAALIPQTEFKRLLEAAQKPPKDLLALQAR